MRTLGIIALCILLLIGGGFVWWKITYPIYTYRYRITVEVEVDGAIKTGSSVIEVTHWWDPTPGKSFGHYSTAAKGEAVFVDLGQGRNVITLLASGPNGNDVDYPLKLVLTLYGLTFQVNDFAKLVGLRDHRDIPAQQLPTFVTFADLNDPKTARVVGPAEFEQVFGAGAHFKRAFVDMVSTGTWPFNALGWPSSLAGEPVTRGIEKKMPMLVTHRESMWRAYSEPMKFTPQYHLFTRS